MRWVRAIRFRFLYEHPYDTDVDWICEIRWRSDGVMYYAICSEKSLKVRPNNIDGRFEQLLVEKTEVKPVTERVFLSECEHHIKKIKGTIVFSKTEEELNANPKV